MAKPPKDPAEELRVAQRLQKAAEGEVRRLTMRVADLEKELAETKKAGKKSIAAPPVSAPPKHVDSMLDRVRNLRELLASTSAELSQLHADEVALSKRRARILADACAVLARAVGESGQAPPPMPSSKLGARLSIAPSVDISEVAELLESLRPPRPPKV